MFNRATDLWPQPMVDELLRLARLDRDWVEWVPLPDEHYTARSRYPTFLLDGPKVFRPTVEQCLAMEQIEVRLTLSDYGQPFPALLVDLPRGYDTGPFSSVLCHNSKHLLSCVLHDTPSHERDIVTTVAMGERPIEVSLQRFDPTCAAEGPPAARALRVAINSCLALTNFDCRLGWLLPDDVERDRRFAEEDSERGRRARRRLPLAPQQIQFDREVVLARTECHGGQPPGPATGQEKATHWRRGHWAMQAFGPGRASRRPVLRPAVLVRKDRLADDPRPLTTTYKTP